MTINPENDSPNTPGIQNPWFIDSVGARRATNQGILNMIESRAWDGDTDSWKREFNAKVNLYVTYIEKGLLFDDHPQISRSGQVLIVLSCVYMPPPPVVAVLRDTKAALNRRGIGFSAADVVRKIEIEL